MSLESVDNVEGGDGLSLGVLSVDNGVSDDVLKETSEDSAGLLVDVGRDSLHTTSAGKSADSGLGDSGDGVAESALLTEWALGSRFASSSFAFAAATDLSSLCHCSCFRSLFLI